VQHERSEREQNDAQPPTRQTPTQPVSCIQDPAYRSSHHAVIHETQMPDKLHLPASTSPSAATTTSLPSTRTSRSVIQPLPTKRSISKPQIARHALIDYSQDDVLIAIAELGIQWGTLLRRLVG